MTEEIERAIEEMFSDMSVSQDVTWHRLQEIIEHCKMLQDSILEEA